MLQLTDSQKSAALSSRRQYIINMAHISLRRQRLLQQMQDAPPGLGMDNHELGITFISVHQLTEELQQCVLEEH